MRPFHAPPDALPSPTHPPHPPLAARVLVPVPVATFVRLDDLVPAAVCDGVRVSPGVCVTLRVPSLDGVPALEWVRVPVDVRVPEGVEEATTHAPHVTPGNPGAPGVALAGTYPGAQVPPHTTPHAV